jgi:transcriptional regulator with XRE-family HTH domain
MPAKDETQTTQDIVIAWIRSILVRKGWTGTDLAREAGLAPSTLLRPLNNPSYRFTPTERTLSKLARASGIPMTAKVKAAAKSSRSQSEIPIGTPAGEGRTGWRRASGGPMVELRSSLPAALQAATAGFATYVAAPPWFEDDPSAFALHVANDAHAPWLKAGSLVFATRRRDPAAGDIVVATTSDRKMRVGPLASFDDTGVVIETGAGRETIPLGDLAEVAVVTVMARTP